MDQGTRIDAILTGKAVTFGPEGETSAIAKSVTDAPVCIETLGIVGDEQADLSVHGGPEKAIHHYPRDHYPAWRAALGPHPLLDAPGAFGENISTSGLTEDLMRIGDRLRLGTALVEICQGRQPCWKQNHRLGSNRAVAIFTRQAMTGWYYRVLEPGVAQAGDMLTMVARGDPDWTVKRVFELLISGRGGRDLAALAKLAALPALAAGWRARAAQLAA